MTDAFNLITSGEYVMGILNPMVRIIGLDWTVFMFMILAMLIVWVYSESPAPPLMVGMVIIASVNFSHLVPGDTHWIIPDQLDVWIALFFIGATAFILFAAWQKK